MTRSASTRRRSQIYADGIAVVLKAGDALAEMKLHAVFLKILVEKLGHLKVQRRHYLVGALDNGDLHPQSREIFRRFKADEAAACYGHALRAPALHRGDYRVHVRDGPELLYPGGIYARQLGAGGGGARGYHQLVVALRVFLAGVSPADRDGLRGAVYGDDLAFYPHVDVVFFPHGLRRLEDEAVAVLDLAADVIGQAAVREGDVFAPLQHHDLHALVQPSESCRAARAAGHAADDYCFHFLDLLFRRCCYYARLKCRKWALHGIFFYRKKNNAKRPGVQ
jgi:hypothetical protein